MTPDEIRKLAELAGGWSDSPRWYTDTLCMRSAKPALS